MPTDFNAATNLPLEIALAQVLLRQILSWLKAVGAGLSTASWMIVCTRHCTISVAAEAGLF